MTAMESMLEGTYRSAHMSLISNAEEIAFYDGSDKEKKIIDKLFDELYNHESRFAFLKGIVGSEFFSEFSDLFSIRRLAH